MKKTWLALVLAVALTIGLGLSLAQAAPKETWKFALEEVDDSFQDRMAKKFKELVEAKTNGEMEVEIYTYGTLGTSAQITEQLMSNLVQLAFQSAGEVGSFVPEIQVFSVDYLLPSDKAKLASVLVKGEAHKKILAEEFAKKDLKYLGEFYEGWQIWTSNKSLRTLADIKGLKMRVMPSPMLVEAFKAYGANPTPLPYAEVYSGLQLKMIDAQVNPYFAIQEMKFYEVQDYMTNSKQLMFVCSVNANLDFYNDLKPEYRRILDEAVTEIIDYSFIMEENYANDRREMIKKAKPGMNDVELTDEEISPFKEKAKAIEAKYLEIGGPRAKDLLEALKKDVETYGK